MEDRENMRFARIQRNRTVCIDGDAQLRARVDKMLDASFERIDCKKLAQADLRICDGGQTLSQADMDMPVVMLDDNKKEDGFAYVPADEADFAEYLKFAVADEDKRRALMQHTPFVAVISRKDEDVLQLVQILQTQQSLVGVGVIAAAADAWKNCSAAVMFVDDQTLADALCRSACDAAKQAGIPVAAILDSTVTREQVQSVFSGITCFCDGYDLWAAAGVLQQMLHIDQLDAQSLYEGALLCLYGFGRPRDIAQSMQLLSRAAQMRHVGALICLADCGRYRIGCAYDAQMCNRLLEEAARILAEAVMCTTFKQLRQTLRDADVLMQHFIRQDKFIRARMLAVRTLEICDTYLQHAHDPQAIQICQDHAHRIWTFACERDDFALTVQSFCRYAHWCFARIDTCTPAQVEWILSQLDALTQQAIEQQDHALMRLCTDTALLWQEFQTNQTDTVHTRAALIGYLDLRGELDFMDGDYAAARTAFSRCVALCQRQDMQQIQTMRTLAKAFARLGDVCCHQSDAQGACQAFEQAMSLWERVLEQQSDAQTVVALCQAIQKHACSAVQAEKEDALQIADDALQRIEPMTQHSTSALVWQSCAYVYGARAKLQSPSRQSVADYQHAARLWRELYELTYEENFRTEEKQAMRCAKADLQAITPPTRTQRWLQNARSQAQRVAGSLRQRADQAHDALKSRSRDNARHDRQDHGE